MTDIYKDNFPEKDMELNMDELEKVSGGTDFDENDVCPVCGSRQISLILYARMHHCENCGYDYD